MLERAATERTIKQLCATSEFTMHDIKSLRKKFAKAAGGAGGLTEAQLGQILSEVTHGSIKHDMVDKLQSVLDQDGDGLIDFKELVMGLGMMMHAPIEDKMALIFDVLDTSGDGRVSHEELIALLKTPRDDLVEVVAFTDDIMSMLKRTDSGAIRKGEFVGSVCRNPLLAQWFEQAAVGVVDVHPTKRAAVDALVTEGNVVSIADFGQLKKLWAMYVSWEDAGR